MPDARIEVFDDLGADGEVEVRVLLQIFSFVDRDVEGKHRLTQSVGYVSAGIAWPAGRLVSLGGLAGSHGASLSCNLASQHWPAHEI